MGFHYSSQTVFLIENHTGRKMLLIFYPSIKIMNSLKWRKIFHSSSSFWCQLHAKYLESHSDYLERYKLLRIQNMVQNDESEIQNLLHSKYAFYNNGDVVIFSNNCNIIGT